MSDKKPTAWNDLSARPCRFLMSKEMFYDSDTARDAAYSSGIFQCLKTHQCFGPDGLPTDAEDCRDGRACFEV